MQVWSSKKYSFLKSPLLEGIFFWNKLKHLEITFQKLHLTEKKELSINYTNVGSKGFREK